MQHKESNIQKGIAVLADAARNIPNAPGIYKMLSDDQQILYIGKAKDLPKRIKQYTNITNMPNRLRLMVSLINKVEFLVTKSETEALLLEASLIRSIKPKFNAILKDDKSFPYIAIDSTHDFPQIFKSRGKKHAKISYFGPFANIQQLEKMILELEKMFKIRSCSDNTFSSRARPCLLHQIARCSAPCVGKISKEEYKRSVDQAKLFLSGKTKRIQTQLLDKMEQASAALEFEKAAKIRDTIALLNTNIKTIFLNTSTGDTDIFAYSAKGDQCCIQVIFVRNNQNYVHTSFYLNNILHNDYTTTLMLFCLDFYRINPSPKHIWINLEQSEIFTLQAALEKLLNSTIHVSYPTTDPLMTFAVQNTESSLAHHISASLQKIELLDRLAMIFGLRGAPQRIEVYDNSHLQGQHAVGCMIVVGPEKLLKDQYRKFIIKHPNMNPLGGDDYAMMREVMTRRIAKLQTDNRPDLIILDGGKGQLSTILEVFKEYQITDIQVIAIAKGEKRNAGREIFFTQNSKQIHIEYNDPIRYYLQNLRDEAHRFAITTHRKLYKTQMLKSEVSCIPGIGPKRQKNLLSIFGSWQGLLNASLEELQQVKDIGKNTAIKIYNHLHGSKHL